MMRLYFLILLAFCFSPSVKACFCFPTNICSYLEDIKEDQTKLTFKGSFIQSEPNSVITRAVQFKIEKIYTGEVVTPDSPFYTGEEYKNTDSTIWLLSGPTEMCLRHIDSTTAIFTVTYNTGWGTPDDFGYVPTSCAFDYFPISEDSTVTGWIKKDGENLTMPLAEFETLVTEGCDSATKLEEPEDDNNCIYIYPQPASEFINIDFCDSEHFQPVKLYNSSGQEVQEITQPSVYIGNLEGGIYYLVFYSNNERHLRKIIKI